MNVDHKSTGRTTIVRAILITLMAGCASNSPPTPHLPENEQQREVYLWGSEILPKSEEIFYATNAVKVPISTNCMGYRRGILGKLFITDKATYYVLTQDTPRLEQNWNYQENRIEAEPLAGAGLWSCVVITDSNGKSIAYHILGNTGRVSRLINYFVEQAQHEQN